MDGGTGSFGLCVDYCIEHLFENEYIEGVRHAGRLRSLEQFAAMFRQIWPLLISHYPGIETWGDIPF